MKATNLLSIKQLQTPRFWLLAIASVLVAIQLTLTWRADEPDHLGMSFMFWLAVASLLKDKRDSLRFESDIFSGFVGLLLIAWVLLNSFSLNTGNFIRLSPFISALGLALLASGFKGLKQYWQELSILFFLGVPRVILSSPLADISPLTAKLSSFLLWFAGFPVQREGVYVILPKGAIEVYPGCSGIEAITYLLGLSVIFITMFPLARIKQIFVPIIAVTIAFIVNGIRVALMALLVAASKKEAFDYWHEGDGSMIFAMTSVLLFGLFCFFLLQQEEGTNQKTADW